MHKFIQKYNFLWLHNHTIKKLITALNYDNHQFKFVGGCIRDSLYTMNENNNTNNYNIANIDFDIASNFTPEQNQSYLKAKNIKTIPTGIKYGTITALIDDTPFQITSLRKDISSNGRHPEVSFSNDFFEDALRRDFTFNALYFDPQNNTLSDYFNGEQDLSNGNVNFIGDSASRIKEDYLRILRFFRFFAKYGKTYPRDELLNILTENAINIQRLSVERISSEFYKLLQTTNPTTSLELMLKTNVISEIMQPNVLGIKNFANLLEIEKITNIYDITTRLSLIIDTYENNKVIIKKADLKTVKNIIQLKNFLQNFSLLEFAEVCELLSHYNHNEVIASLMVMASINNNVRYHYISIIERLQAKAHKHFPITGEDLIKLGFEGIEIKEALVQLKKIYWQSSLNNPNIEDKDFYLQQLNNKLPLKNIT